MRLVIAEKPSVSASIAKVLGADERKEGYFEGNGYIVTWCLGHIADYAYPEEYDEKYKKWDFSDLPIIPDSWQMSVSKDKRSQYKILKALLNDNSINDVVNACDAGREGELIFRRVYEMTKSKLPIKRLWINSMEDSAISEGFDNLKDGHEFDMLAVAAAARAKADWLVGINATRAYTTKLNRKYTIGRVQTPTVMLLVERDDKINHFIKEPFYKVIIEKDGMKAVSENIKEKQKAAEVAEICDGKTAEVISVKNIEKRTKTPRLYDLTSLQREANRFFGYSASDTLYILQGLYEKKLVTYPRTDSQYITEDMISTVSELIIRIKDKYDFLREYKPGGIDKLADNSKVSDHTALLPTEGSLSGEESLSEKEKNIYNLIVRRLMSAASSDYIFSETEVIIRCEDNDFKCKGRTVVDMGFKSVENSFDRYMRIKQKKDEKEQIITVNEGDTFSVIAKAEEHFSTPPKPYTEDTLLAAMESAGSKEFENEVERKGLGTPATRASIIEKIIQTGYVERKGKQLNPTQEAYNLINILPDYIKSASLTAEWENKLLDMEKGKVSEDSFYNEINNMVQNIILGCEDLSPIKTEKQVLGKCPICGADVVEYSKSYSCSDKECKFVIWKENKFLASMKKKMDKRIATDLINKGKSRVNNLVSSKGNKFNADLVIKAEDGKVSYSLEFPEKK